MSAAAGVCEMVMGLVDDDVKCRQWIYAYDHLIRIVCCYNERNTNEKQITMQFPTSHCVSRSIAARACAQAQAHTELCVIEHVYCIQIVC